MFTLSLLLQFLLHPFEVKATEVEYLLVVHVRSCRLLQVCHLVDDADLVLNVPELVLLDQVDLVHDDLISVSDLLHHFVCLVVVRLVFQVSHDVFRVHHGDQALQPHLVEDARLHEEGAYDRHGVSQTSRLYENVVELILLLVAQVGQHLHQVLSHSAAYAAVIQQQHVLSFDGLLHLNKLLVNAYLPELVLDHSNAKVVVLCQNLVQQSRFPRTKEARNDSCRDARVLKRFSFFFVACRGAAPLVLRRSRGARARYETKTTNSSSLSLSFSLSSSSSSLSFFHLWAEVRGRGGGGSVECRNERNRSAARVAERANRTKPSRKHCCLSLPSQRAAGFFKTRALSLSLSLPLSLSLSLSLSCALLFLKSAFFLFLVRTHIKHILYINERMKYDIYSLSNVRG